MTFFPVLVRLPNVSISREVQHQIFQNKRHITTDISKNTFKTLHFLSNVIEMKFKSKKLPENRQSPETIQVQSDMSHMQMYSYIKHYLKGHNHDPLPILEAGFDTVAKRSCIQWIKHAGLLLTLFIMLERHCVHSLAC